jgi:hypothetical protein
VPAKGRTPSVPQRHIQRPYIDAGGLLRMAQRVGLLRMAQRVGLLLRGAPQSVIGCNKKISPCAARCPRRRGSRKLWAGTAPGRHTPAAQCPKGSAARSVGHRQRTPSPSLHQMSLTAIMRGAWPAAGLRRLVAQAAFRGRPPLEAPRAICCAWYLRADKSTGGGQDRSAEGVADRVPGSHP